MKWTLSILIILLTLSCVDNQEKLDEPEKIQVDPKIIEDSIMNLYDSLMSTRIDIPELVDSSYFSIKCINQFEQLAKSTGGQLYFAISPDQISQRIIRIIDENVGDNADLLLIIDRTGSMRNDLKALKAGLNGIIDRLSTRYNVSIAIATFGDKQVTSYPWYDFKNFSTDYDGAKKYIQNIKIFTGMDDPESVYDAVMETSKEDFWASSGKRISILLGDAASHDSSLSQYSAADVIQYANKSGISMNIFPIVISPKLSTKIPEQVMREVTLVNNIYPNPTKGIISIQLTSFEDFKIEVYNQAGRLVYETRSSDLIQRIDLSEQPPGMYILRVSDRNLNFDTKRILKN